MFIYFNLEVYPVFCIKFNLTSQANNQKNLRAEGQLSPPISTKKHMQYTCGITFLQN